MNLNELMYKLESIYNSKSGELNVKIGVDRGSSREISGIEIQGTTIIIY